MIVLIKKKITAPAHSLWQKRFATVFHLLLGAGFFFPPPDESTRRQKDVWDKREASVPVVGYKNKSQPHRHTHRHWDDTEIGFHPCSSDRTHAAIFSHLLDTLRIISPVWSTGGGRMYPIPRSLYDRPFFNSPLQQDPDWRPELTSGKLVCVALWN